MSVASGRNRVSPRCGCTCPRRSPAESRLLCRAAPIKQTLGMSKAESVWSIDDLATDLDAADWINVSLQSNSPTSVRNLVPDVFEQFVRVLHPAERRDTQTGETHQVTWATVARASGTVAHSRMQWSAISSAPPGRQVWDEGPSPVSALDDTFIETVADTLSNFTSTPSRCYFAFWEGNTSLDSIRTEVSPVSIGDYRYYVVAGPLSRATTRFHGLRPHMWWPEDRTWFVAAHFDFTSTFIGGPRTCADRLITSPSLEAWETSPAANLMTTGDTLNMSAGR